MAGVADADPTVPSSRAASVIAGPVPAMVRVGTPPVDGPAVTWLVTSLDAPAVSTTIRWDAVPDCGIWSRLSSSTGVSAPYRAVSAATAVSPASRTCASASGGTSTSTRDTAGGKKSSIVVGGVSVPR